MNVFIVVLSMVAVTSAVPGLLLVFRVVVAIPSIIYASLMVPIVEVKLTNPVYGITPFAGL